jgi:hypothetical protein
MPSLPVELRLLERACVSARALDGEAAGLSAGARSSAEPSFMQAIGEQGTQSGIWKFTGASVSGVLLSAARTGSGRKRDNS